MVRLQEKHSTAEGLVGLLPGHLAEQKLIYDVMASGSATAVPDLMLTSSLEGSLDEDYLIRNQEPVYGDPGRDALLLGRMQSLTCDGNAVPHGTDMSGQTPEFAQQTDSGKVFSGVPLGFTPNLMVLDHMNRSYNVCGGGGLTSPFEYEYPEVKIEDNLDPYGMGTGHSAGDMLLSLSMSMSMSMSLGLSTRLSNKVSNKLALEDFPVPEMMINNYPESCLMPMLREPIMTSIKPKAEDFVMPSYQPDYLLNSHLNMPPHGSPTTPEMSSTGHASETEVWDYEQFAASPTVGYAQKETRKSSRARRDGAKMTNVARGGGRSKGVTMCLRTLLRQLLAGTGWIMDSSMSKDHATRLIRELIGPELDKKCHIQLSPDQAESMKSEQKEEHYSQLLAELASTYTGKQISYDESLQLIKRDKGPYHLTQQFIDLLGDKPWPPCMISEKQLRNYGCYRQGEASKRGKMATNVQEQ